jgi:hypothetical protein
MKQNILLSAAIAISSSLCAQITITKDHMIKPGKKVMQAYVDGKYGPAKAGANMTWDFSDLPVDDTDSIRFGMADWYEGHENFPMANRAAITYSDQQSINFMLLNDTKLSSYGYYSVDNANFQLMESQQLSFPSTYQTSFTGKSTIPGSYPLPLGIDPDSTGPFPTIDSLVFFPEVQLQSIMNGWGTLKTPLGSFPVLRQQMQETLILNTKMYTNGIGVPVPAALMDFFKDMVPPPDTMFTVNFWTNSDQVGLPLMTYYYNPGNDSADAITWTMSESRSSDIPNINTGNCSVYPNPVKDLLNIQADAAIISAGIYNMEGQLLSEQTVNTSAQMDLQSLPTGLYTLQLKNKEGIVVQVQKIVKI